MIGPSEEIAASAAAEAAGAMRRLRTLRLRP
jgi:hypothetical protein